MNTTEEKKIILARFLGFEESSEAGSGGPYFKMNHPHLHSNFFLSLDEIKFDTSLDWLKVVIDEIAKYDYPGEPLSGVSLYSEREHIFDEVVAAVEFIKENNVTKAI
jgi:hypothetical protein